MVEKVTVLPSGAPDASGGFARSFISAGTQTAATGVDLAAMVRRLEAGA